MRIGLIGAGRWGTRYITTLARMPGTELTHVGSHNPETRRLVPEACRVSGDWRAVLADQSLDGVILASPPMTHAPLALEAIAAGLPVLIEKPMAMNVADAQAVAEAANAAGVLVMVGHTHLFSPAYRALKQRGNSLGRLHRTQSSAGNDGPVRLDTNVLWDWGPHDVAMCVDLFGDFPESVQALIVGQRRLAGGMGQALALHLVFPEGGADIKISNIEDQKLRLFEASYEYGRLIYDDIHAPKLSESLPGQTAAPIPVDPVPPLTRVVQEFADSIGSNVRTHPSLTLGVQVVQVLAQCEETLCPQGSLSNL
ncbi:MAG: Gfo/Idh/MocA family oxidoreductase [Actinomycetia bacterium]|nr:Gfo/Idh/MocA family oxidoreductase [Actinomycetes bacterium]